MIVNTQYNSNKSSFTFDDETYDIQKSNQHISLIGGKPNINYTLKQTNSCIFAFTNTQDYVYCVTPQGLVPVMGLGKLFFGINIVSGYSSNDIQDSVFFFQINYSDTAPKYIIKAKNQMDLCNISEQSIITLKNNSTFYNDVAIVTTNNNKYIICGVTNTQIRSISINSNGDTTSLLSYSLIQSSNNCFCAAGNGKFVVATGNMTYGVQKVIRIYTTDSYDSTNNPTDRILVSKSSTGSYDLNIYSFYFDHFINKFVIIFGSEVTYLNVGTSNDGINWDIKEIPMISSHKNNLAFDKDYYYIINNDVENYYIYDKNFNQISKNTIPFVDTSSINKTGSCGFANGTLYINTNETSIMGIRQQDFITINKEF